MLNMRFIIIFIIQANIPGSTHSLTDIIMYDKVNGKFLTVMKPGCSCNVLCEEVAVIHRIIETLQASSVHVIKLW